MSRPLTPTEERVAALACNGRSTPEIARELDIGVKTVETHLAHAYRKLGVRSRDELRSLRPHGPLTSSSLSANDAAEEGSE